MLIDKEHKLGQYADDTKCFRYKSYIAFLLN